MSKPIRRMWATRPIETEVSSSMRGTDKNLQQLKETVATANRLLAYTGLSVGPTAYLGHASSRLGKDKIVMKGRGYPIDSLAKMRSKDMIILDMEGNVLEGPPGVIPQNEVKMHTRIYLARKDVGGVVHVHPRYSVLLSVLGKSIVPVCNEGIQFAVKPVPVYKNNELICFDNQGDAVVKVMGKSNAVLLRGHGVVTSGRSVQEATINMIILEEQARMNFLAMQAGGIKHGHIPIAQAKAFLDFYPTMGNVPVLKKATKEKGHKRTTGIEKLWTIYSDLVRDDKTP